MNIRSKRMLGVIAIIALMLTIGVSILHTNDAHAASYSNSGVQIQFSCGSGYALSLRSVIITGNNQYGQLKTWNWSVPYWWPFSRPSVTTNGWWWEGPVNVQWTTGQWGGSGNRTYYVPYQYGSSVYSLHC